MMQAPVSQGFNRFAYAFNSPHNYVDPSGFNADPTTVGIDAGIATAYGAGLYFTLAGGSSVGAGVSAGTGVGLASAGVGTAGAGAAEIANAASGAATGVGLVLNTAIISGMHPAGVAPHTVQASSRSAAMTSQGTPHLGRTNTAVGTAPVQEAVPVPKAAGNSEWGPTPDLSNTAGAHDPAPSVPHRVLNEAAPQVDDSHEMWKNLLDGALILSPLGPEEALEQLAAKAAERIVARAGTTVYRSVTAAGKVQYVGITNNLARRAAEHLTSKGIQIEKLMGGLARSDARAVEQTLIEIHGLGKNGGTLANQINSIARSNPAYAQQLQRGYDLLRSIGY
jgi:hypothetical protein